MTKINTIYDQIRLAMSLIFPNKTEIDNPYFLADNAKQYLDDGYGVAVGDGNVGNIDTFCDDSLSRSFEIILTKEVFRLEAKEIRLTESTNLLLIDQETARRDLRALDQLDIATTIQKIEVPYMSGIEQLRAKKFNFLKCTLTANIEYTEAVLNS